MMKIGITGASGFIGSELVRQAQERGDHVVGYSRTPDQLQNCDEARAIGGDRTPDVSGLDAVVHLAGESILGIWTEEKKQRIRDSRVLGTKAMVSAINDADSGPRVFVSGSAVGFYGDTGETLVNEDSEAGSGFLPDVCEAWEAEAGRTDGVRTVIVRTGFVVGPNGGAMQLIGPVFRMGLGGKLGSGQQWMSCIHVADVAGILLHAVHGDEVVGVLNAVMPEPVRNAEFTKATARAAHRPAIFPAPTFALKLALGQLSHLLLDSQRVAPTRTTASGYEYRFADVDAAMKDCF